MSDLEIATEILQIMLIKMYIFTSFKDVITLAWDNIYDTTNDFGGKDYLLSNSILPSLTSVEVSKSCTTRNNCTVYYYCVLLLSK